LSAGFSEADWCLAPIRVDFAEGWVDRGSYFSPFFVRAMRGYRWFSLAKQAIQVVAKEVRGAGVAVVCGILRWEKRFDPVTDDFWRKDCQIPWKLGPAILWTWMKGA
jgi:hypothetical protein